MNGSKVSASIELIWALATQETVASEFKEIQPEHFLAAILKFIELADNDLKNIASGAGLHEQLVSERNLLRKISQEYSIDTALVRRSLRNRIGKGGFVHDGGQLHRSPSCRQIFDAAQKIAEDTRSQSLNANHLFQALLEHPTAMIVELVEAGKKTPEKPSFARLPSLSKYTRDITELVSKCDASPATAYTPAAQVVVDALAARGKRCVILVVESPDSGTEVILHVAQRLLARTVPLTLRSKHVLEVVPGRLLAAAQGIDRVAEILAEIFAEADSVGNVVLYLPEMRAPVGQGSPTAAAITRAIQKGSSPCICVVSKKTHQIYTQTCPDLLKEAHVAWLHDKGSTDIPSEL